MSPSTENIPDLPRIPVNRRWILATLVSTAAITGLLLAVYYPQLPDPMPVHWNAAGEADRFQDKTMGGFLGMILLGPGILLLTLLASLGFISMQSGHITEPGGAKTPNEAHRTWLGYRAMMKHLGWYMFTLNLVVMLLLLRSYSGNTHPLELTVFLIVIFGLTGLLLWVQIREQQAAEEKYPKPPEERGKTWGIFHNDPDDRRILVDTGGGTNFTFNIGRPAGKVLALLFFVILPLGVILWIALAALTG